MSKLFKYLKGHKLVTVAGPLLKLAEALMETFVPYIMSLMINYGIKEGDTTYIIKQGILLLIIAVFGWIFGISAQYFCARASMLFGREIRNALYDKILKMDMKTIDRFTIPSLITRTTSDVNRVQTGLNLMLRLMLRIPFVVAGAIIMSGIINLKIMLIFIALVPLIAVVTTFAVKKSMPFYERIQKITDNIGTFCRENILGVKSVRAFGMQKKESADFQKKAEELYDNQVKAEYYNSAVTPFNTLLINVSIVIILLLGSVFVSNKELMSGDIIAFVSYLSVILVSVERTCTLIISFNKAQTSSVRVAEVLEYKKDDNDISEESHAENESVISFDNVTFCYESKSKPAIQDISFSVSKGESLGIIGGTGSGKSTVLNLLQGAYLTTSGSVCLNGNNVKSYKNDEICKMVSVVPQKAQLFKGTVRYNLSYGNDNVTDEEILDALDKTCSLDFINEKGGLDFEIEYGGRNLSGGQKQRLTIARAILKKADVLILDDSTSALDYVTESKIRKFVTSGEPDFSAKVIISQRISAVMSCDKILVLEDGKCAGYGSHEELAENCEVYREILLSQTGMLFDKGGKK